MRVILYYRAPMSKGTPSQRLPQYVEPRKLAISGATFHRILTREDLPRLAAAVLSIDEVSVSVNFGFDEAGRRHILWGRIDAEVQIQCQRCLEAMPLHIAEDFRLACVRNMDEAKQLPKDLEPWVVGIGEEDLHAILEEELLLTLPSVPKHKEFCLDRDGLQFGDVVEEEKLNPFSVLQKLKQPLDK